MEDFAKLNQEGGDDVKYNNNFESLFMFFLKALILVLAFSIIKINVNLNIKTDDCSIEHTTKRFLPIEVQVK